MFTSVLTWVPGVASVLTSVPEMASVLTTGVTLGVPGYAWHPLNFPRHPQIFERKFCVLGNLVNIEYFKR